MKWENSYKENNDSNLDENRDLNRNLDIDRLKSDLKSTLQIQEVFERYYYPLTRKSGDQYSAICPFHTDNNQGSFVVTPSRGSVKCFSCGAQADIIGLVQKRYNLGFIDAIYKLALDYGFISEKDFESKNIKFDESYEIIKQEKLQHISNIKSSEAKLSNPQVIDTIYNIFSKLSSLTKSDYKYLLNERNIEEHRIKDNYFTMPLCTEGFMRKFVKALSEKGLSESDLIGVPGFFMDEKRGVISFLSANGIGIKVKDANGVIGGIQIRLTKAKVDENTGKSNRYSWFSSARQNLGCGPGSPVDVSYPDLDFDDMKRVVFITEGKFKSERINKYYDCISLSVQGITSWKNKIKRELEEIIKKTNIKCVYLCYDADMAVNMQVYNQCKLMVENELSSLFPPQRIYMVSWDISKGKGIDDLIDNGYKDSVKKAEFPRFVELFENFLSKYPKNDKGELIDENTKEVLSKDVLYDSYMKEVFPKL